MTPEIEEQIKKLEEDIAIIEEMSVGRNPLDIIDNATNMTISQLLETSKNRLETLKKKVKDENA